jgi:4-alpha-glucanotransferase
MPAFADLFQRGDLDLYRAQLEAEQDRDIPPTAAGLVEAALARLAASDAYLVVADVDDLLGETRPHNVPGKVLPGIWRRRFAAPTSATLADPRVRRGLSILTSRHPELGGPRRIPRSGRPRLRNPMGTPPRSPGSTR